MASTDKYWCGDPFVPALITTAFRARGYSAVSRTGRTVVGPALKTPIDDCLGVLLRRNRRFPSPRLKDTAQIDVWVQNEADVLALEVKTRMYLQVSKFYGQPGYSCDHSVYHFGGLANAVRALLRLPGSSHEQLRSVGELLLYGLCLATHWHDFAHRRPHLGVLLPFYARLDEEMPAVWRCLEEVREELSTILKSTGSAMPVPEAAIFVLHARVDGRPVPKHVWVERARATRGFRIAAPATPPRLLAAIESQWRSTRYNHLQCSSCRNYLRCASQSHR
jgi:hypothetical protein